MMLIPKTFEHPFTSKSLLTQWLWFLAIAFSCTSAATEAADSIAAELIWIEHGDMHQIHFSEYSQNGWTLPRVIWKGKNYINSLAINTDREGAKFLVFTEYLKSAKVLKSISKPANENEWSESVLLSDFGRENLAASMVQDMEGVVWLFWSANRGDLDDIYLSKMVMQNWSEPIKVNVDNDVPDTNPIASLNENGEVMVEWQTFSMETGSYVTQNRVFELDINSKNRYKAAIFKNKEINPGDLSLPSFLPNRSLALIHFPNNLKRQSSLIDLN